jgi:hypothetical protein
MSQPAPRASRITISVRKPNGVHIYFGIRPTVPFRRLVRAYVRTQGCCPTSLVYDGTPIGPRTTPQELCMPDGAVVDIVDEHRLSELPPGIADQPSTA